MPDTESKLYYSISEVSKIVELEQYVLRYWETEFTHLKPKKNRAGNRVYKSSDIELIKKIKNLLYDKKFTIAGAIQFLKDEAKSPVKIEKNTDPQSTNSAIDQKVLLDLKKGLDDLLDEVRDAKKDGGL
ncbi:MAG: MerR family transcriptional regulator [Candidatus Marinimicrobia bacterium]|nr:MerR family transcriptional regulator [Candidatus Neomarinimicrobiota bacterium]